MAQSFKGKTIEETCRNIWQFLKDNITYVADTDLQAIQSPDSLLKKLTGDCKSYSVFAASILDNLGIPYFIRFSSNLPNKRMHHVYIVVPAKGKENVLDAVMDEYNNEVTHEHFYTVKKKSLLI